MALAKGDGGAPARDRRRHWAYIRVGYKGGVPQAGGKAHKAGGTPVFRWVRVGSPLYRQLRDKGIKPVAVRAHRSRPTGIPKAAQSGGSGGGGGKTGSGIGAAVGSAISKGGGGKARGIKASVRRGRKRRGKGSGDQAAISAISKQIGSAKVGKKLDTGMADTLAGLQYDAPIHDVKTLIDRLGPQNAQALADISNWFGQAQAANMQAGSRNAGIANDVAANQDAAVQGLMASLGGGGNDANAAIAVTQLNDSGLQRVLGGIEQQYHNDTDPLLAQAAATAQAAEQRRNLQQMQDYQLQLADLLGQRGQAKASNLLELNKYNNELAQQQFQNMLAKVQAGQAAASLGLDLRAKKAQLKQAKAQSKRDSGKFIPWNRLNPAEKTQLLQAAVYDPTGAKRPLAKARSYLVSLGYAAGHTSAHNAAIISGLQSYYR